ncbi:MAG: hypothetical protein QW743_05715 [Candidatus Methanomethylicia archaeon]|uniref:hypothetical protein n=1 Tax=Thermofilum sp. TaxID=1961369 RepID=UPI003162AD81
MESEQMFKGRAGASRNLRKYFLYVVAPKGCGEAIVNSIRFVGFTASRANGRTESKAQIIYRFLEEDRDKAFFAREIADLLADRGLGRRTSCLMLEDLSVGAWSTLGVIGVRDASRLLGRATLSPGSTHLNLKEQAIPEAFERTEKIFAKKSTPIIQRVQAPGS